MLVLDAAPPPIPTVQAPMKIVLSRKGFDSACGGAPSPLLPDGTMLSLPIPAAGAQHPFRTIGKAGRRLGTLVEDLTRGRISQNTLAHLDPDLDRNSLPRLPGWRPAFGQTGAAATHLARCAIGPGDLFLFFGWFRPVVRTGGVWHLARGAPDQHVIFGWLQIGEVIPVDAVGREALLREKPWLHDHPHLHFGPDPRNTLYLAGERLTLPGIGRTELSAGGEIDRFHPRLVLTCPGARGRSTWRLPDWFAPDPRRPTLTYHRDPSRWTRQGETVQLEAVAQGQEFVLDCRDRPEASAWVMALLGKPPHPGADGGSDPYAPGQTQ